MQVIALSGRHRDTESWMRSLSTAAGLPDTDIVRYRHWTSEMEADVSFEAARLADQAPRLVIAKSMGTVIASTAFARHEFRPAAAVFIGMPFAATNTEGLRLFQDFARDIETLFIQQIGDPGGAAGSLREALHLTRGEVVAVPGDDHRYTDTTALVDALRTWLRTH